MSKELNEMSSQCLEEALNDPRDLPPVELVENPSPKEEGFVKDKPGISSLVSNPLKGVPDSIRADEMASKKYRPLMVGGDGALHLKADDSGRERLKRHRTEVAGRVWIPDIWGQEDLLKDWVDCSVFDAQLVSGRIMSARAALVEEGRRANTGGLRIENRC